MISEAISIVIINLFKFLFIITTSIVYIKTIFNLHFPWEKCPCCGKKLNRNHRPLSVRRFIDEVDKDLDRQIEEDRKEKMKRIERNIERELNLWDNLLKKIYRNLNKKGDKKCGGH
jgi:hypothetical protein